METTCGERTTTFCGATTPPFFNNDTYVTAMRSDSGNIVQHMMVRMFLLHTKQRVEFFDYP